MGYYKYFDEMMNNKLNNVHVAYLAKVLSVSGNTAKIQPLGLVQSSDGTTSKQSVLTEVPICEHVRHYRIYNQSLDVSDSYTGGGSVIPSSHGGHVEITPIVSGDIVVCLCCEQNITQAKKGKNALPPKGRFSQSDSIIVGVL